MDITDLIPEFNQYTLLQKKLFLDWIELPVENDEKARNRFLDSLNNSDYSNPEGELNEREINERLYLLMERIQKSQGNNSDVFSGVGGNGVQRIHCKMRCGQIRDQSQYKKCFSDCVSN